MSDQKTMTCVKCDQTKPETEFNWNRKTPRMRYGKPEPNSVRRRSDCRECQRSARAVWGRQHSTAWALATRPWTIKGMAA